MWRRLGGCVGGAWAAARRTGGACGCARARAERSPHSPRCCGERRGDGDGGERGGRARSGGRRAPRGEPDEGEGARAESGATLRLWSRMRLPSLLLVRTSHGRLCNRCRSARLRGLWCRPAQYSSRSRVVDSDVSGVLGTSREGHTTRRVAELCRGGGWRESGERSRRSWRACGGMTDALADACVGV